MSKLILCALRDIASCQMAAPVLTMLAQSGHRIALILEGPAIENYPPDHHPGIAYTVPDGWPENKVRSFIAEGEYDLVIAGLGYPRPLEGVENLASAHADNEGIPLVYLDDVGGGYVRDHASRAYDWIITTDWATASLLPRSTPAGFVSYPTERPAVPVELAAKLDSMLQRGEVVVFCDFVPDPRQAPDVIDKQINLLAHSLDVADRSVMVVPCFHPKWKKVEVDGRLVFDRWMEVLDRALMGRYPIVPIAAPTDQIVAHPEITLVSGGGSYLMKAAVWGNRAVALRTDGTVLFRRLSAVANLPIVAVGAVPEISAPTDIFALPMPSPQAMANIAPYDPQIAFDAILRVLNR